MERITPDGQRLPVDPSVLAKIDQMEAHYQDLTGRIMFLNGQMKHAALVNHTEALVALTKEMDSLVKVEWPGASADQVNFLMYLIHLLGEAQAWTESVYENVDALIRQLGSMARVGHQLHRLPGFDQAQLVGDMEAVLVALDQVDVDKDKETFTTDTGVELLNVHPEGSCEGAFCVVHKPAPGPWETWDTHWRDDWNLMVRICPHDVQHVAIEEKLRMPLYGMFDHNHPAGCDCPCDFARLVTLTDEEGNITGFQVKE